jgi:hypothetical protein
MLHEMLHADAQLADNVRVRLCLKIGSSADRTTLAAKAAGQRLIAGRAGQART